MLYYTVGLPRSGKSTLCNQWINRTVKIENFEFVPLGIRETNMGNPRVVVCADDIRLSLHGQRYQEEAEEMVHSIKHVMVRAYLIRDFDVLVDGTHTSHNSVDKLHDIAIQLNAEFIPTPTNILTSVELCKERAKATNQEDLIPVIDRMNTQLMERGIFCRE